MKRILIVEDDKLAAELERDYLVASGYEVDICGNGNDGLLKTESEEYDLIILDIMLPGINGFEICREIRQKKNVPIILVTAKTEDPDLIRGLNWWQGSKLTSAFMRCCLIKAMKRKRSFTEIW